MRIYPHPSKHKRYSGNTWWLLDFGSRKNQQKRTFEGTYEEAEAYGKVIEPGGAIYQNHKYKQIKDLVVPFMQWYKNGAAPTTIRDYRFIIDLYLIPYFGNLRPAQLTLGKSAKFKEALLDKGLTSTTINKHINYFSSLLKWATENEHCEPLTFKLPRFPKKKTTSEPAPPSGARSLWALPIFHDKLYVMQKGKDYGK